MTNKIIEIKNNLVKNSRKGLALDIDETLSWTVGYWVEQLQQKFGNPENLSIKELVAKYRYAQDVPYWQTKEAFDWIKEARNSSDLQELLPLIENANHIIQKINKIISIAAYITVRPNSVIEGTKKWLKKHDFPEAEVVARPDDLDHGTGNKWKAEVLEYLYPQIVGIVDDNSSLVNYLSKDYKGTIYLYDNTEVFRNDLNIIPCKTWEDVFNKVKENH